MIGRHNYRTAMGHVLPGPMVPGRSVATLVPPLRLVADGYESENRREKRFRLARLLQRCPPGGHLVCGDLAGLPGPRFETGDERYAWLNWIQAVGKGTVNEDLSVDYEWYEVR